MGTGHPPRPGLDFGWSGVVQLGNFFPACCLEVSAFTLAFAAMWTPVNDPGARDAVDRDCRRAGIAAGDFLDVARHGGKSCMCGNVIRGDMRADVRVRVTVRVSLCRGGLRRINAGP
ncbi:hypothetical protein SETIT_9G074600v2 [Setaria italica]|uniref:Uncharacterized protein n=1 Tax=Setaria italica TaxID=4555 RepID=A0A368SE85_SETIT|nr:hypothetical protein SETIT_9G074600v2 [Setaria italica]